MKIRYLLKDIYYYIKFAIRKPFDFTHSNHIDSTNRIARGATVNRCTFGRYNYVAPLTGMYNVVLGSYCSIGPLTIFGGMEHSINWYSMSAHLSKLGSAPKTKLGNDVWVGANCVIKAGITIGNGAVIGAHSFVNKDVPPYAVVVGSPAKVIKYRLTKELRNKLEEVRYWENSPQRAKKIIDMIERNE